MKTLNLASYGVEELDEVEMREVNGGIFFAAALFIAGAIAGGMIYDLINNTGEVGEAITAGGNAARGMFK
jgi:hypothetical protein